MPSVPETRASLILRLPDAADVRAWDEFVAVYAPLVYRLSRRRGLQPADSDDLVQEVLSAVARSVEAWLASSDRGPFRAWLLRIARNKTVDFLTRAKHRAIATGGDTADRLSQYADSNGQMASEFDWEYRRQVFSWAAEQVQKVVTEKTWRAFWLSCIENQPIAEVVQRLGINAGNVYIARSRVMARLREYVRRFEEMQL